MRSMFARRSHMFSRLVACAALVVSCGALLLFVGCGKSADDDTAGGLTKVKVCYIGLTCEPPIYVAYELGFFKEEGLDVELVKSDWDSMRDGLGLGRFDATHHLIMYLLKPIDQGLDVKLTGGIHSGCLRVQAGAKTDIRKVNRPQGQAHRNFAHGRPAVFVREPRDGRPWLGPQERRRVDHIPG